MSLKDEMICRIVNIQYTFGFMSSNNYFNFCIGESENLVQHIMNVKNTE